jgi:hypothetical protein
LRTARVRADYRIDRDLAAAPTPLADRMTFRLLRPLLCTVFLLAFAGPMSAAAEASSSAVAVKLGQLGRPVPRSFLGLSIETNDIPHYASQPAFAQFLHQLEAPGQGPLSVRIGGESADSSVLASAHAQTNEYVLNDSWFRSLKTVVSQTPMSLIFDLNLVQRSPAVAATEAHAVLAHVPRGTVSAFEIGNEPDLYDGGLVGNDKSWLDPTRYRWAFGYSPTDYVHDFNRFATAIRHVSKAPLAGPALAYPNTAWLTGLKSTGRDRISMVTQHRYPFCACFAPPARQAPTVAKFLSPSTTHDLVGSVSSELALARRDRVPLRISEFGTASCGGQVGVTDTFVVGLWAPDLLFSMLASGVDGINVHTRYNSYNTPLIGLPQLTARPLFDGLAVFARMLGAGARLEATRLTGPRTSGLTAWATRLANGSRRVLLTNRSSSRRTVMISLGAARATVEAFRASSLTSQTATFAGQQLGPDGRWHGQRQVVTRHARAGVVRVSVPPYSILLVSSR